MNYKAIIFDLDGTLLNSLIDIADSVNFVLKKYNLPVHSIEDYKLFIGSGIEKLVERALPDNISDENFRKYLSEIKSVYEKNQISKTKPYDGILEMLKILNNKGVSLNILSNKPINFTKMVVEHFLGDIKFDNVLGAREGVPKKPNPQAVFEIIDSLKLNKEEVLYVGDTGTDMQTAENAGLTSVGVLWGFRGLEELMENNADYIIEEASKIIEITFEAS
jgi:phosphoglycolate phosphatase